MKKLFLTTIIVVVAMTSVVAQNFGVKAGLNLANVRGDAKNVSMLTSFHVGAFAEFKISDTFSFQPELVYSVQGAHMYYLGITIGFQPIDATYNFNYINLPLMAKYKVSDNFSVLAGPQIGFLTSAKVKIGSGNFSDAEYHSYKSTDFGLNLGIIYELRNGLFFDLRYDIGFSNIIEESSFDLKNSVISFSLGYKIK